MNDPLPLAPGLAAADEQAARQTASSTRDVLLLALFASAIVSVAIVTIRFSEPTPGLLDHARVLASTGREPMPYYQTGYVVMLAAGLILGGERGIVALQAIAFIADVLLAYLLVVYAGGSRRAAVIAAIIIAVHPYLVFNVKRIVDNNLAIPALLLATLAIIEVWLNKAQRLSSALIAGLALGFAMLARSNFAPLLILVIGVFVVRGKWRHGALAAVIAIAMVLIVNRLAGGYWRLSPSEGGYTFFLGANPFTAGALIRDSNPEGSLAAAATADKIDFEGLPVYTFVNSHEGLFLRLGFEYIVHHPFEYLWLSVLKLVTLLRPDYRQIGGSMTAPALILIVVQTILALIVPLWVAFRLMLRHQVGVFDGIWAIPIVAILMLSLVIVTGDPRYRLPFEVIAIVDAAWCYERWSRRERTTHRELRLLTRP